MLLQALGIANLALITCVYHAFIGMLNAISLLMWYWSHWWLHSFALERRMLDLLLIVSTVALNHGNIMGVLSLQGLCVSVTQTSCKFCSLPWRNRKRLL